MESDLDTRFWDKVDAEGDCWNWTGAGAGKGYGYCRRNGVALYAHRYAYEQLVGPIPAGRDIDHLCRNRRCVNPDHLQAVTRSENISRGVTHRGGTEKGFRWEFCHRGKGPHRMTEENRYYRNDGRSQCRACHLERGL